MFIIFKGNIMKILVFDEWLPWPLESGKKIRSYNLMSRIAKYHQIIYLAYVRSPDEDYKIEIFNNWCYKVIPVNDVRREKWKIPFYFDVVKNIFSKMPFSTQYHITEEYVCAIKEAIDREKPDLVHCEWSNLAPCYQYFPKLPTVISSHNIESDIWKRWYAASNNLLYKLIAKQQAERIETLEKFWYPKADVCISVSEQDKQVIESYGANAVVVENGVDIDYYSKYEYNGYDENCLVFTASFDTFSNQNGVEYFINEIYPIIKRSNSKIKLYLVGKEPTQKIKKYGERDSSIIITGSVPDVRPFIAKASVCVVPLRIGGGSRLKILEALAMKKPVVSTTIGAEGLSVNNGIDILLADEPHVFAENVLKVLGSSTARDAQVDAGYSLVKRNYDWNILADLHNNVWLRLKS